MYFHINFIIIYNKALDNHDNGYLSPKGARLRPQPCTGAFSGYKIMLCSGWSSISNNDAHCTVSFAGG